VIRLLIWAGAVVALLGFFYASLDGGGVRKDARQRVSAPPPVGKDAIAPIAISAAPPSAAIPAPPAPPVAEAARPIAPQAGLTMAVPTAAVGDRMRPIGRGLSFALADATTVPARVAHLACHGEPAPVDRPHRGSCNPYEGDTSCASLMPIACHHPTGAVAPPGLAQDFYKGWTRGQLAATRPVPGTLLTSEPAASARCEAELGAGWCMAEFHDGGGGWGLQGERGSGLRAGTRYWVHINDQRGNCWNSPP